MYRIRETIESHRERATGGIMSNQPNEHQSQEDIFTLLSSEATRRNPYPVYARLREKQRVLDTGAGVWFLFGYEDCNRLLRNSELSVDERNAFVPGPGDELPTLLHLDPPDHGRLRKLVQIAFTPKRVEALRDRVEELVQARLDTWKTGDVVDVIAELAYPVPLTIICELLGIDEDRRSSVQEWSTWLAQSIDPGVLRSPELNARIGVAEAEFVEEIRARIIFRRTNPGDDLLSQLVMAEADGDRLTEHELLGLAVLLLVAGHETTVSLIGNGLHALLRNPGQLAAVMEGSGSENVDAEMVDASEAGIFDEGPANDTEPKAAESKVAEPKTGSTPMARRFIDEVL
jgi:cytochrome P450